VSTLECFCICWMVSSHRYMNMLYQRFYIIQTKCFMQACIQNESKEGSLHSGMQGLWPMFPAEALTH